MLRLRLRVVVDESHLDAVHHQQVHLHLAYLICKEMTMVHHLCAVENPHLLMLHLMQVAAHLDVLQIRGEQNLDVIPSFLDVERQFPQVAAVDVGLRHLLKMDCYQDVVDAVPRYPLKMDCCLDEVWVQLVL
jgi:hypothetical protein